MWFVSPWDLLATFRDTVDRGKVVRRFVVSLCFCFFMEIYEISHAVHYNMYCTSFYRIVRNCGRDEGFSRMLRSGVNDGEFVLRTGPARTAGSVCVPTPLGTCSRGSSLVWSRLSVAVGGPSAWCRARSRRSGSSVEIREIAAELGKVVLMFFERLLGVV